MDLSGTFAEMYDLFYGDIKEDIPFYLDCAEKQPGTVSWDILSILRKGPSAELNSEVVIPSIKHPILKQNLTDKSLAVRN